MTDNGSKTRPVRTLTAKNFSVIKEAKLEFGKITVLIGPQAGGKSLLCKLAFFLGGEIIELAVDALLNRNSWSEFLEALIAAFNSRFSTSGWITTGFEASFSSQNYRATIRGIGDPLSPGIVFSFSEDFQSLYNAIFSNPSKQPAVNPSLSGLRDDLWAELNLVLNERRTQANVYIPSDRAFFADPSKSVCALQSPDADEITKRFARQLAWDTRWKVGMLSTGRGIAQEIEREIQRISGGVITVVGGRPFFLSPDGRNLPLSIQSSGTQELAPAFTILTYLMFQQEHLYAGMRARSVSPLADISENSPLIFFEEPEAHVFPKTQYDLVRLFAWLAYDQVVNFDWIITTHSPYVLSVFGDLVKAGKVGLEGRERHSAASKVIPDKYWINPNDFAAYRIDNGKLESIYDQKTGQIDGDYLDDVSGKISDELGQLLEIQYGK